MFLIQIDITVHNFQAQPNRLNKLNSGLYGIRASSTTSLLWTRSSLGSLYIRRRMLIYVAAALDSCLSKFGSCFIKPNKISRSKRISVYQYEEGSFSIRDCY